MRISFKIKSKQFNLDTSSFSEISIPLLFDENQPNIYDTEKASSYVYESGKFIGDTRRGGGCNFEKYSLITHCNGTHTECVGHISYERISINDTLKDCFIPAVLISVSPENALLTNDKYIPDKCEKDFLITKKILFEKIRDADIDFLDALIIRTIPNDDSKKTRRYMLNIPPFFSIEAMEYITNLKVKHLLIDLPSVDRTFDEGKLTAHHIFWNVPFESHEVSKTKHSLNTITEMVYIPDEITDGKYIVNIQIPDFAADAAPSRIFLYNLES